MQAIMSGWLLVMLENGPEEAIDEVPVGTGEDVEGALLVTMIVLIYIIMFTQVHKFILSMDLWYLDLISIRFRQLYLTISYYSRIICDSCVYVIIESSLFLLLLEQALGTF
jgi:hypothetical protein